MDNWEQQPYDQRLDSLKRMIVSYTKLAIQEFPDKKLNEEVQIANGKVNRMIEESTDKSEMVNNLTRFYGVEINFLLNTLEPRKVGK